MSIPEFSETLRKYVIDKYEKEIKLGGLGEGVLKQLAPSIADSKKFRAAFEAGSSGHDSIITIKGLEDLGKKLAESADTPVMKRLAQEIFSKPDLFSNFIPWLKNRVEQAQRFGATTRVVEFGDKTGLRLENISQSNAKKYFEEYIGEILDKSKTTNVQTINRLKKHISQNIEAGHLAGIFSLKFKVALGVDIKGLETAKTYRDFTVSFGENEEFANTLEVVIKSLLDADYLTSNIVDKEELFLVSVKKALGDNPTLETELQFGKDNGGSGALLGSAGKSIKALITALSTTTAANTSAKTYFKDLIKSLENLQLAVEANAKRLLELNDPKYQQLARDILTNNQVLKEFINSPGSPSIIQGIEKNIINILKNGKVLKEVKTAVSIKKIKTKKDPVSQNLNKIIKDTIKKTKQVRSKVKKETSVRVNISKIRPVPVAPDIVSLQNLLDSSLQEKIRQNMGTGNRRDVLNYRSGRFASSVKVERISESRQGMITAFYTYMKNPYATFSQGGRQELPRSRDPKLLISKSIRDIASTLVANRLRAVSL